jgi:thiaminase
VILLTSLYDFVVTLINSGRFIEYLLDRPDVQKPWQEHTEHSFVSGLADGTLPAESFKYYLVQDYLFLV